MSGGHFDYKCFSISQFAEELKEEIQNNNVKDEYGFAHDFEPETIARLNVIQQMIELAGKLAREVEWLYSGDHGDETFCELIDKILGGVDIE